MGRPARLSLLHARPGRQPARCAGQPPVTDQAANQDWRTCRGQLAALQRPEGHWEASGQFSSQRRPRRESDAAATMWTLLALTSVEPLDGPTRDRALAWLRSSEP